METNASKAISEIILFNILVVYVSVDNHYRNAEINPFSFHKMFGYSTLKNMFFLISSQKEIRHLIETLFPYMTIYTNECRLLTMIIQSLFGYDKENIRISELIRFNHLNFDHKQTFQQFCSYFHENEIIQDINVNSKNDSEVISKLKDKNMIYIDNMCLFHKRIMNNFYYFITKQNRSSPYLVINDNFYFDNAGKIKIQDIKSLKTLDNLGIVGDYYLESININELYKDLNVDKEFDQLFSSLIRNNFCNERSRDLSIYKNNDSLFLFMLFRNCCKVFLINNPEDYEFENGFLKFVKYSRNFCELTNHMDVNIIALNNRLKSGDFSVLRDYMSTIFIKDHDKEKQNHSDIFKKVLKSEYSSAYDSDYDFYDEINDEFLFEKLENDQSNLSVDSTENLKLVPYGSKPVMNFDLKFKPLIDTEKTIFNNSFLIPNGISYDDKRHPLHYSLNLNLKENEEEQIIEIITKESFELKNDPIKKERLVKYIIGYMYFSGKCTSQFHEILTSLKRSLQ